MSAWRFHPRQGIAAGSRRGEGTGSARVRRSMGRRCREAMCAGALRHRRANFAPSPTPTTPTKVVARLAREELRVSLLSPASRRSPSSRFFPASSDRAPARPGASNISSPMAGRGSFWRWAILDGASVWSLDCPGGRKRGIRDLAELRSRALAEPVRRSGEHWRLGSRDGGWRHSDRRSCLGPRGRAFERRSRCRVSACLAVPPPARPRERLI